MPVVRRLHGVAMEFMLPNQPPPYVAVPEATDAMNVILMEEFPTHPDWQLGDEQALALMVLMRTSLYKPLSPYYPVGKTLALAW